MTQASQTIRIREKPLQFGAGLVGISTEGIGAANGTDKPAVILLNSGILHRVGSCRLSVRVARALAAAGHYCVRFDSSGIGDSEVRRDSLSFEESAPLEITDLMNYMQRMGKAETFVLFGLCSGADMAFETAKVDPRVVGIVQIDPYAYKTLRYYWHHYAPRMMHLGRWVHFAKRKLGMVKKAQIDTEVMGELEMPSYIREFPSYKSVLAGYRQIAQNPTHVLAIYTAEADNYNYANQFSDLFRSAGLSAHSKGVFVHTSDHMITRLNEQTRIIDMIEQWMRDVWPDASNNNPSLAA